MLRRSVYLYISKMIGYALHLAIPIVLVRVLSVGDFGSYRQFFLMELTILSISQLGVAQALFYFVPRDRDRAGIYLTNSLAVDFVLFLLALAVFGVFRDPLSDLFDMPLLVAHFWVLMADILFIKFSSSADCYILAREQVKASAIFEILGRIFISSATVATALLTRDLGLILMALVSARGLQLVAMSVYIQWRLGGLAIGNLSRDIWPQVKYGAVLALGSIVGGNFMRLHNMIVTAEFGREVFAIYSAGCTEIPVVQYFAQGLATVALPRIAVLIKENDWPAARKIWREILTAMYAFGIPVILLFVLVARPLVLIMFTPTYADAVDYFMVNSLIKIQFIWNATLILRACNRNDVTLWINLGQLVLGVPLLLLAAEQGGPLAVLVCHGLLMVTGRLIAVRWTTRITGQSLDYVVSVREIWRWYRVNGAKVVAQVRGMLARP